MLHTNYSTESSAAAPNATSNSETSASGSSLPDAATYYASQFQGLRTISINVTVKCVFHNDDRPSLSVNRKTGTFNCFGCGAKGGNIIQFHMKRYGLTREGAIVDLQSQGFSALPSAQSLSEGTVTEWQQRLWFCRISDEASRSEVGDLLYRYIVETRGIPLKEVPPTLGLHPGLPYTNEDGSLFGMFPAMVAPVLDLNDTKLAIHRTYLSADAQKAPVPSPKKLTKALFPGATKGGAIQLFDPGPTLAVAEGIETSLAVHSATGLPVWATVSAGGMESVRLPKQVREVIICVDQDKSGRGQRAAYKLAGRLMREGRKVKFAIPQGEDVDWADVLGGLR